MAITVQEAQVIFSADGLNQVQTKAGQAGKALDRTTTAAGGLISKLKGIRLNLGGLGSTLAGLGAGAAAGGMMSLAAGAEQTAIAFEVLLGSASKSKDMVDAMRALDMKTVFGMRELSESAKMMLNFGVAGDQVVPVLEQITAIAAGDAMKLEGLTRAFGQMSGAGRLMGQDLNQMINAGFNPLQQIAENLAKQFGGLAQDYMPQLKRAMEDGKISIDMVRKAIADATTGTGRFAGMNDRMSQTTAGQFAKLKSDVELLAIAIGTELLPEANKLLEWARSFFDRTENVKSGFRSMKESVVNWFTETQEKFEGVGVVIGVTAVHMVDIFKNAFADIQSLAAAAFEWITSNAMVMVDNMGIRIERMKLIMGMDAGPEAMMPLREFEAFQTPNLKSGDAGMTLREKIDAELEVARKLKNEQKAKGEDKAKGEEKGLDISGLTNPNNRMPGIMSGGRAAGKSETFSAEALFASLRESALSKQIGLQTQSVNLQSQAVEIAEAQLDATKKINMGLA
jgi:tape measure domain-containing protein